MAHSDLVHRINEKYSQESNFTSEKEGSTFKPSQKRGSSFVGKNDLDCMPSVRRTYRNLGFSRTTTSIIMASWRTGTKKQYQTFIKRWFQYCFEWKIDPISPSVNNILEFLTLLFDNGLSYSSLNTARGALSALGIKLDGTSVGSHALVIRYMKGVYNIRPTKPRYSGTWDVSLVLRLWSPVKNLSLKQLTLKLVMLIALTNAARAQSIHLISVNNMKKCFNEYIFEYSGLLKQCRPGYKMPVVHMKAHPPDRRLCIYVVVKEYLSKTAPIRNGEQSLLLSYVKPHKAVTRDTVSRWIKMVMKLSGVNTDVFGSHSVRSASVSKAKSVDVPVDEILRKAGWTNATTFSRFYEKDIIVENESFASGVLSKNN